MVEYSIIFEVYLRPTLLSVYHISAFATPEALPPRFARSLQLKNERFGCYTEGQSLSKLEAEPIDRDRYFGLLVVVACW